MSVELVPLLSKGHELAGGAVIWIEPTRAAVMVDIDSAASNLAPAPLARLVLPEIFYLLRLRGLAGRVLIDIPYLSAAERQQVSRQIESLCSADPGILNLAALPLLGLPSYAIAMDASLLTRPLKACEGQARAGMWNQMPQKGQNRYVNEQKKCAISRN